MPTYGTLGAVVKDGGFRLASSVLRRVLEIFGPRPGRSGVRCCTDHRSQPAKCRLRVVQLYSVEVGASWDPLWVRCLPHDSESCPSRCKFRMPYSLQTPLNSMIAARHTFVRLKILTMISEVLDPPRLSRTGTIRPQMEG